MSKAQDSAPPVAVPLRTTSRGWLAVGSVSFGAFALVTSELMPVGLLPRIAGEIGASVGATGLMVTVPGLVAAFAAPALVVASGRLDRRLLLWLMGLLLIASNLIAALAPNLSVLLVGRFLLGVGVGGFWAIGAAAAGRLAPSSVGRATALVFAGISGGTVIGLPTGALLGGLYGWRVAFMGSAALCGAALLAQFLLLPSLPPLNTANLRQLPAVFRSAQAGVGLAAVALLITGQFVAYTYMAEFLETRAGASEALISGALLAYGVAGLVGNTLAGELVQRDVRKVLAGIGLLLGATILMLPVVETTQIAAMSLVVIWGFAFGGAPVSLQTWMFMAAPELMEGVGAVFVSIFQLSLAAGALLGGVVVDGAGTEAAMMVGGSAVLATAGVILIFGRSFARRR